ncbi:acetylcholine receptor subunit beta-like 2 [Diadema antillarum]|uniref:acetylcholine receptor subunit beta-like 2 n=1 Tax=Diadema antillarum TaxID=105358 RepID=UPI003A8C7339
MSLVTGNVIAEVLAPSPQWNITVSSKSSSSLETLNGDDVFSMLILIVRLDRLPSFYIYTIVLPLLLINIIGLITFLVPLKSGERISACISVLLGLTVFQIVLGDIIPQTSRTERTPIILAYASMSFFVLVAMCASSVLMVNISFRPCRVDNRTLQFLLFRVLATLTFMRREESRIDQMSIGTDSSIPHHPENTRVRINNRGDVNMETMFYIDATCPSNLKEFPFDHTDCFFFFSSMSIPNAFMVLVAGNVIAEVLAPSPQWNITVSSKISTSLETLDGDDVFSTLVLIVRLDRLPSFYIYTIVLPLLLINIIGLITFLVPLKSGERISACISVLLGLTVFQIVLGDIIPQTSRTDRTPIILVYGSMSFFVLVAMCVSSVLLVNISFRPCRVDNRALQFLLFRVLATLTFMRREGATRIHQPRGRSDTRDESTDDHNSGSAVTDNKSAHEDDIDTSNELVANMLDRILFFVFAVCHVAMAINSSRIFNRVIAQEWK